MKVSASLQGRGESVSVLATLMILSFSFSSCLRDGVYDGDTGGLSPADKYKYVTAVAGDYSGYLYFQPGYDGIYNVSEKVDSVPMTWEIVMEKDTTATFQSYDFPVSFIGLYSNVIPNAKARNVLSQGTPQPLTAKLTPLNCDNSLYVFWMLPQSNIGNEQEYSYTVDYEGRDHVVTVIFSVSSLQVGSESNALFQYPLATYSSVRRQYNGTLLLSSVSVDEVKYNINAFVNITSKQKQ